MTPAEIVAELEVDSALLDLRLALAEADIDGLADRLDRLEAEVADLRQVARRRWGWWR